MWFSNCFLVCNSPQQCQPGVLGRLSLKDRGAPLWRWAFCSTWLAGSHRLAKEEVSRQELRQRVRMADNEVMDAFRKIMAARQKKRTPTKKEKDQAWKTLKERESILKLLDG